jgi:Helix-turn-helix domain
MIKAHKIRLHPTTEQATYFAKAAGTARYAFNRALAEWKRQSEAGEKPSALQLRTQFHALRKEQLPWTYDVTKCAIEGAFMDVAAAFNNFFEGRRAGRKTGYPQFKSKKRSRQSFYLANDKFRVGDHWIDVPKLGRVNMAESLRFQGKILSARISKNASWWFVSITVHMPDEVVSNQKSPVGVDVGLNRLATLSDGRRYENQRPLGQQLKKLRRLNKELARRDLWRQELAEDERAAGAAARRDCLHSSRLAPQGDHPDRQHFWHRRSRGFARTRADAQSLPFPLVLRRRSRHAAGFAGKQSPPPGRDAAQSGSVLPVESTLSLLWGAQSRSHAC